MQEKYSPDKNGLTTRGVMMADEGRVRKVQDQIHRTVASFLKRGIKDPRLENATITDVRVSGDLQHATVFYTVYGSAEERADAGRGFNSAKGTIRATVGKELGLRLTPTLDFTLDALPESAAALEDTLELVKAKDAQIAKSAHTANYAGGSDPYKTPKDEQDTRFIGREDEDQLIRGARDVNGE